MLQILRLLQFNLFDKRDLLMLLKGHPPPDGVPDINQMALLAMRVNGTAVITHAEISMQPNL